jgi:hypothetical protein
VGSLLALYANQRKFEPTAFSESFEPNLLLDQAMKNLGVSALGGAGGGGSSGSRRVSMSYRSSYQKVPGTTQSIVLEEVHKIVEKQIVDSGCEILGTGLTTGKFDDDSLREFEIEYKNRNAFGQIRVRTRTGERGDWQFWIDIFEY